MSAAIYFIIGANGVGKSTVLPHLRSQLPADFFELHDFDERGVPDNADKTWRISETDYWINLGEENKTKEVSTIICGFSKPAEINGRAEIVLLDVAGETLAERLKSRYQTDASIVELNRTTGKTVEKFVMDNVYVASLLRKECEALNCKIIDTTLFSSAEVAERVIALIKR